MEEVADLSNLTDVSGTKIIINKVLANMSDGVLKQYLNSILPSVVSFVWSIILALIVYGVGVRAIKYIVKIVRKPMEKRGVEAGVIQFVSSVVRAACYALLVSMILTLFGISTSSIAAAIASVGLTAGLALQGSLANFAGGVLILLLKPFKVGDYIKEDTHSNEGTVSEITIFYTKLKTIDNKVIVIPNGPLANASLTNYTMSDRRVIHLTIPISYSDDIKKAKQVLVRVAESENNLLEDSDIKVYVDELGESAVLLGMRFWVPTDTYWDVRWNTLEEIKIKFDENGISIPFNQLDVHVSDK